MKSTLSVVLVVVLFVAGGALAADPQVKSPTDPQNAPVPSNPDLSINKAEIEAGVVLDVPAAAAKAQDTANPLSPMMVEIKTALDASRAQVAELSVRASNAPDHQASVSLQREIAQIKQQAELDILAIQARFARENGNEDLALRIDDAIESILNPPAPEAPTHTRQVPVND